MQTRSRTVVRAYRALLPPHAPDMLTVRIQVIDGTGTFTCQTLSLVGCSLPSTGVIRLQRYCEPLRHPKAPGLSLAGVRLVIADRALRANDHEPISLVMSQDQTSLGACASSSGFL
jgi:hypothetical protein